LSKHSETGQAHLGASEHNNSGENDIVWGVAGIAKTINRTPRQAYHMIDQKLLRSVKKIGGRYCASRNRLLAELLDGEADASNGAA